MKRAKTFTRVYALRLTEADYERLASFGRRLPIPVHVLARAALRLGMAAIEANPNVLLGRGASGDPTRRRP